jgi:ferredoxin-NADP reductase
MRRSAAGRAPSAPVYEPAEFELELLAIRPETEDVSSFDFRLVGPPGRLKFHPGQALTLRLAVDGETAFRTFTIASSPTRPELVTLTVKAAATGRVTRWMRRTLSPGMRIAARGPVGRFSVVWHYAEKLLLVSAGSGATPMISALRWLADRREPTDIAYLHVARRPEDLLFREELPALQQALPNLRAIFAVTAPPPQSWTGPTGRLTRPMFAAIAPDAVERETFCCGPAAFMSAVEAIYSAEGGDPARFHTETFGVPDPPVPAPALASDGASLMLTFGGRSLPGGADSTVLAAALAGGLVVPTGCRNGICGACRLRKLSGEVEMRHNGGLSPREERDGLILACCSRPRSDLVLEMPGR